MPIVIMHYMPWQCTTNIKITELRLWNGLKNQPKNTLRYLQPYFNIGILYCNEIDSLDKAIESFDMAINLDKIYLEAYYAKAIVPGKTR